MSVSSPQKLLINANEYTGIDGKWLRVINPVDATAEVGQCYLLQESQIESVLTAAQVGFDTFRKTTSTQRSEILKKLALLLLTHEGKLAQLITMESGKPITQSKTEVKRAIRLVQGYSDLLARTKRELYYLHDCEAELCYFPLGPVLAITPFNFPLNLIIHKLAPAIAAGNALTIKPSSKTPLTALYLGRLAIEAGYTAINVVPCGVEVAETLVQSPVFKKLSFTGSADVGWRLNSLAGRKPVSLELGGNAACIIEDYDPAKLKTIAKRVADGSFLYAGQICVSVQRILVNHRHYDAFTAAFLQEARDMVVGDPMDEKTEVGPMISVDDVFRSRGLIKQAIRDGANVLYGGNTYNMFTLNPTVFNRTTPEMIINRDEVFAPIVTIAPYETFEDAIALANDSRYGLQAGVYTQDNKKAKQAFEELNVGGVMINEVPSFRLDELPYGGIKDSGLGREGLMGGIAEMSNLKTRIEKLRS